MPETRRVTAWSAYVHPKAPRPEAIEAAKQFSLACSRGAVTKDDATRAVDAGLVITPFDMSIN